ncbi:uncharacterized protein LOC131530332 isoform X3 [Onychostoma macrolepis]|uniref:uncharacterized protein LOC131530332 isoform X3 n=1 Tax=Onychostoma macrolepis TaxID=369639 RepID=UPI00272D7DD4|nr:uncharacterized protein LOC131530332 isoform X3 [Onychostoma macrolepis]
MKSFILSLLLVGLPGASCFETHGVSELEGNSVTLHTDVKTSQRDRIRWYFNDTRIAQISGDLRKICTDVQCNEGNERFRDRLKLDHQTGSLTITHTRTTDSGLYHQETITSGKISEKIFNVTITGRPGSEAAQMKRRMEGASDTLDNGKNKGATRETYDDEKIASSEMMEIVDYQSSKVEKHNSRDAVSLLGGEHLAIP